MTHTPDEPNDPAESGSSARDQGAGRKLDEDAAWRDIVAHYGDIAGVAIYAVAFALIDRPLAHFQIGLASGWILPDNRSV